MLQYVNRNLVYFAKTILCVGIKQWWWRRHEFKGTKGKGIMNSAWINCDRAAASWEGYLHFPESLNKLHDTNVLPSFINPLIYLLIDCFADLFLFCFICLQ